MLLRRVTLHQLKIFISLARCLNMTRAAEELHMTPAALSIQIKQLSGTIGAPLHEQIGKRLFLTDTGRLVYAAALDVFDRMERLSADLAADQGLERGTLKLSIITTAQYFAPRFLGAFCKQHPGIEATLEVANRDQLIERLKQNLDDLYIMGQAPEHMSVIAQPFMENPLVLVAPADHPLAALGDIEPEQLAGESFIMREPGSGTRLAAERFFEKHGVRLKIRMTLGSNEAVKQAVAGGLGLAVLSQHTLTLDQASGAFAVLDVRGFPLLRQWYVIYPSAKQISPVTRGFLNYITAEGASRNQVA
ncbi:MAG: LysR substrate-binding domain-containing protein [Gammaproteobacteria bacterium]|nr:LysR substrate-binding domain-containing protein [Gammaproteobacteria bacterium]